MPRTKREPQFGLEDEQITDGELVKILGEWADQKERIDPLQKHLKGLVKNAKKRIEALELKDGTYRCGVVKITIKETEERDMAFTVESKHQVRFTVPS